MKKTNTGVRRSIRAGGKLVLVAGASVLVAVACGGDEGSSSTGDGDGDGTGSGGVMSGTGGANGSGGLTSSGGLTGSGGAAVVAPTTPGAAVATPITAGTFAVDMMGFGTDATNGLQGFAYTYIDEGGSVIYPSSFGTISETEIAEGKLCANGTGAEIMNDPVTGMPQYSLTYGGGIGWNLNQSAEETTGSPMSVAGFDGVTFTMVAPVAAETRFLVNVGTQGYCTTITAGETTVLWSELNSTCWDGLGDTFDPTTMMVESVAWQIVTKTGAATPFDFCVGGLTFNGDGGGGMGGDTAM